MVCDVRSRSAVSGVSHLHYKERSVQHQERRMSRRFCSVTRECTVSEVPYLQ